MVGSNVIYLKKNKNKLNYRNYWKHRNIPHFEHSFKMLLQMINLLGSDFFFSLTVK